MNVYHGPPRSSRNHYRDPPNIVDQFLESISETAESVRTQGIYSHSRNIVRKTLNNWSFRNFISLPFFLILLWIWALRRGERSVFWNSISECAWDTWEQWPTDALPHHLVFVADPQLVDPHTYPGRPWPLSFLTVSYTDQYMRRVYSRLQQELRPDSTVFLGDLFDGGREWSTPTSESPEARYKKYGEKLWHKEYQRFSDIFFKHFNDGGTAPNPGQPARRLLASIPGNHDLGFAAGVQKGVRNRFNAYFGEGNRVDVIGNHTFVSLDSVSLSALAVDENALQDIYRPAVDYLDKVKTLKSRAVSRELRMQNGHQTHTLFKHAVIDTPKLAQDKVYVLKDLDVELPTVLLSHVPLYRPKGTPCGPLRERWPPSPLPKGQREPLAEDERNAIAIAAGYQYQNVLTRDISKMITEKVGNIYYAFSGDDHDYCEVVHRGYQSSGGGIREITVKSLSWAMGVRKPGFLMVSLWNPIDGHGRPLQNADGSKDPTLQTHLCLLPDQLSTFIHYGFILGITLTLLVLRAALLTLRGPSQGANDYNPLLPLSSAEHEKANDSHKMNSYMPSEGSSSNSSPSDNGNLAARMYHARIREVSPGGYGLPGASQQSLPLMAYARSGESHNTEWQEELEVRKNPRTVKGSRLFVDEMKKSVTLVAGVVLVYYFWLIWRW
ncbi:hypothetical protein M501DRAFT_939918 [Patellaria atrata CBS 101060]|uniref:Calcineurin-like phosphoesterase domain-containing protein n=1 Tax=Patellaria atrata CBS 101060 TaxID=1346257 RepID=A0A9P4S5M4_9PEZI|nr:hypothetical protein M501DRAFT_939918 [Patellaria atrata CBS 101060]